MTLYEIFYKELINKIFIGTFSVPWLVLFMDNLLQASCIFMIKTKWGPVSTFFFMSRKPKLYLLGICVWPSLCVPK